MKTFMNGAMLALLSLAVTAVRLEQTEEAAVEAVGTSVSITPEEADQIKAELLTSTSDVIIKDGVQEEGFAGNISEDSEEDDCGCECPEACPYDNMVALPKDLYKDAKAEYAAKIAAEKLEPLVVEMALPWADILAMNPEDLDAQILLPMFEDALENQMKENPELRHALPNKPNHLQEQVEMVLQAIKGMDGVGLGFDAVDAAAEGVERHTMVNGSGWIETMEDAAKVEKMAELTPVVLFFSSESNADANNAFSQKWRNLQRTTPGAMYFRVDVDQLPELAQELGVTSTPEFVAGVGDNEIMRTHASSNGEWVHFKNTIGNELTRHKKKDTWNPEDHEGNVTKKETRRTDSNRFSLENQATKVDARRIKDDAVYEGYKFEKDGEGDFDYSLEKTA